MLPILFSLLFIAFLFAWFQRPRVAIYIFSLSLITATIYLLNIMTDATGISL